MKNQLLHIKQLASVTTLLLLGLLSTYSLTAISADALLLANKPLADSTTSDVLPNLMFILDNSGSMDQDYTPDWAGSSIPFQKNNAVYNTQYYNPTINYFSNWYPGTIPNVITGNQTSWTAVRNDAYYIQDTGSTNLVGNADYYYYVPGEYCTTQALDDCLPLAAPTAANPYPTSLRWCTSTTEALKTTPTVGTCRAIRESTFTNIRTPSSVVTLTFATNSNSNFSSITVGGKEILSTSVNSNNATTVATGIKNAINSCTNAATGNCATEGYSATSSGAVVTIVSNWGSPTVGITPVVTRTSGSMTATLSGAFVTRVPGSLAYVNIATAGTTYAEPGKAIKAVNRTDCAGTVCTYAEEMTNYANWWTYYRTRMQGMKTSASLAFKPIDSRYRVGFITIANQTGNYLPIAKFDLGTGKQKELWYKQIFKTDPQTATPLREALSVVGAIFAGKKPIANPTGNTTNGDPMEYACQQNFALLTTDGYWNGNAGYDLSGNAIGDLDGGSTPRPLKEGTPASSGSLADVSKYYYDSDIRTPALNNCTGALGQDVCGNGTDPLLLKQNMSTFTLGLGIDGTLLYSSTYKTDLSGDFNSVKSGSKDWADPIGNAAGGRIDDLWHAAVNANGTYFSARNPKQLTDSLKTALSDIKSIVGVGSGAAASSLSPVPGNNFEYVPSYTTVKWTGNLEARTISTSTFKTSEDAIWCAEDVAGDACAAPAVLTAQTVAGSSVFYCKTLNSNTTACNDLGGFLDGATNTDCEVEVATSCVGTMAAKVVSGRTIFFNSGGGLANFSYGNLNASLQQYFGASFLQNNLSQWADLNTSQQTTIAGNGLVNYLRGDKNLENKPSNPVADRVLRYRETTLGDMTESQPVFVGSSGYRYTDANYDAFKTSTASRSPTIYIGANDGMLHAFNANNGDERWAFVPTPVIPNMWKLADRDYATGHLNYVNGDPIAADIAVGSAWKTILVGGLNGGGRGYYALDITDPSAPSLLWEYTAQNNANLGYTFGNPVITKLNDGTWVVLLTTGYNNGNLSADKVTANNPAGNGKGYVIVLNAFTGAFIKSFPTNAGTSVAPSGLGQISVFVDDPAKNNLGKYLYGGDLDGNLWRFDINAVNGTPALNLATLMGPTGVAQPITTAPELGVVNHKRVVFVGTGKYLEVADLNVVGAPMQTLYAIKDDDIGSSLGNPRSSLVQQTLASSGNIRTGSNLPVNFNTGLGWRVDFPDPGEKQNIDGLLVNGVLVVPTIVPASSSCAPGGYGWINFFDYKTGGSIVAPGGLISEKLTSPAVGVSVFYDSNGNARISTTISSSTEGVVSNTQIPSSTNRTTIFGPAKTDGTYGKRSIWRELFR